MTVSQSAAGTSEYVNTNAPRGGQPAKPRIRHIHSEFCLSRDTESPFLELAGHCVGMNGELSWILNGSRVSLVPLKNHPDLTGESQFSLS